MRRLWLFLLIGVVGAPSLVNAQAVTYAVRLHETENSSKAVANNASNQFFKNEYSQFGILSFAANLANDVSNRKCGLLFYVQPVFKKAVLPVLTGAAKAGFLGGESTFGDGTLTVDLIHGVVEGGILTTAGSSSQSMGTSTLVTTDYENLGTQSLTCGGPSTNSGLGTCGAVCNNEGPNCRQEGGAPAITSSQGIATGYTELFIYPLANSPEGLSLCGGPTLLTWAECCNDPNLVVVRHLHSVFSSDLKSKRCRRWDR